MTELEQVVASSPRLSPRTKVIYTAYVQAFVAFAGTSPESWTGIAIENWRDALSRSRKPQTVNGYLAAVRYASRRVAQRHQDPSRDFAAYAEMLPQGEKKSPRALTHDEGAALVAACEGTSGRDLRDMAIIILGLHTGLRRAGICNIKFEDFEGSGVKVLLKGNRWHPLGLDPEVQDACMAWGAWLAKHKVDGGYFFRNISHNRITGVTTIGDCLTTDGLYKSLKRRARAAGVKHFSPHVLRHTFISWCREAGVPDYRIRAVTGHKTPSVLDVYTTDLEAGDNPVGGLLPPLRKK